MLIKFYSELKTFKVQIELFLMNRIANTNTDFLKFKLRGCRDQFSVSGLRGLKLNNRWG